MKRGEGDSLGNPITKLREKSNLSRREMAMALGIADSQWTQAELGCYSRLQPVIRRGLQRLGVDVDQLSAEYDRWYAQQRERAARKFTENGKT